MNTKISFTIKSSCCVWLISILIVPSSSWASEPRKYVKVDPIKISGKARSDVVTVRNYLQEMLENAIKDKKYIFLMNDENPQIIVVPTIRYFDSGVDGSVYKGSFNQTMGLSTTEANASIKLYIQLMDANTNLMLDSATLQGKANSREASDVFYEGYDKDIAIFRRNTPIGFACQRLTNKCVVYIIDALKDVPWQGTIIRIESPDKITINAGIHSDLDMASVLQVHPKGKPTGRQRILGGTVRKTFLEVYMVENEYSIAELIAGEDYQIGDIVTIHY